LLDTTNLPLVSYSAPPVTTGGSFGMDSLTGLISWLNPPLICNYSFSVRVNKWRKIGGVAHLIGMVNRNFFVIVSTGCTGNTGLNDEKTSRVRVYPNPSSGEITFETRQSGGVGIPETLSFYDLSGRFISEIYQENNGKTVLPAEYLSPGMYFYRLTSRDRKTEQGSFVIVPR